MGMRVSGAGSSVAMSAWQSRQQNFTALASALGSGNLQGAQAAFATLTGAAQSKSASAPSAATGAPASGQSDRFAALGQALASGDIAAAQKAFAQLTVSRSGGHHHHHDHDSAPVSVPAPAASAGMVSPTAGSIVNTLA